MVASAWPAAGWFVCYLGPFPASHLALSPCRQAGSLSDICLPPLSSGLESSRPETLARLSVGKCHGQGSGLFRIQASATRPSMACLEAADGMAPTLRATPGRPVL